MNKLASLLLFLALLVGCTTMPATYVPKQPSISDMERETAALVDSNGEMYCSAVWVDGDKLLTAAHCIRGAMHRESAIGVDALGYPIRFKTNEDSPTYLSGVLKYDKLHDLALLVSFDSPQHSTAILASFTPTIGSNIYIVGHPGGDLMPWTFSRGYVSAYRAPGYIGPGREGPFLQLQMPIFGGNSGGGAFDDDGNLVGICSFTMDDDNVTIAGQAFYIHLDVIRSFLAE